MISHIYVNHQTELEDYVTNIAVICFHCRYLFIYLLFKKVFDYAPVDLRRKYLHTYFGEP